MHAYRKLWFIHGKPYAALSASAQAGLREDLKREYRGNRVEPASGVLHVSARRAQAMAQTAVYYERLFSDAPELQKSREHFAMKENTLPPSAPTQWSPTPTTGRMNR
jgi:nitric oxide reductase subunit B